MIAEALDAGTVTIGAVAALLVLASTGGAGVATIRAALGRIDGTLKDLGKRLDRHEEDAREHRHHDNTVHQALDVRVSRVEQVLGSELTPLPREPTGPRRRIKPDEST